MSARCRLANTHLYLCPWNRTCRLHTRTVAFLFAIVILIGLLNSFFRGEESVEPNQGQAADNRVPHNVRGRNASKLTEGGRRLGPLQEHLFYNVDFTAEMQHAIDGVSAFLVCFLSSFIFEYPLPRRYNS